LVLTTITTTATVFAATAGFLQNRTLVISTPPIRVWRSVLENPVDNGSYIQFALDATFFANMSLSFAVNTSGNGFDHVQLAYSTDGINFINVGVPVFISQPGYKS